MVTRRKCSNCGHVYSVFGSSQDKITQSCGKCTKLFSDSELERMLDKYIR